jgi:hypothetical protein
VIFKAVRDGAPYPDHHTTLKAWAEIPPRPIRLADLITTKRELALEDGLHRALRAALQQRNQIHARVLVVE